MNRRTILKGGVILAATSHTAVATADVSSAADPLLDVIRAYQRGLVEFNRNASDDWEDLSERTYGPHLLVLDNWDRPATTRESAMEALRIALADKNGVYGSAAADSMVRAALGYLERLP
jgi:hypothetical protein